MTAKHFRALAEALKGTRPMRIGTPAEQAARQDAWERDVRAVADVCYAANGRFDRDRFYRACGAA